MLQNFNITKVYLFVTISNFLVLSCLYISFPGLRRVLVSEDQFIENMTAILFFCCISISLFFLFKLNDFYKQYIAIIFVSLIAFLDEISFGQRIFNFEEYNINGFKADGVHDLTSVIKSFLSRQLFILKLELPSSYYNSIVLLIKLVLFLVLFGIALFLVKKSKTIFSLCQKYLPLRFVLACISFLAISQIIDTLDFGYKFLVLIEELAEMNLALGLLFVCFSLSYPVSNKAKVLN